jgi:hypothetical protein
MFSHRFLTYIYITGPSTQVVFPNSHSGSVDAPISIDVRALDEFGNVATSENRAVRVVSYQSPVVASSGIVSFTQGVGSIDISSTLSGSFTFGFIDDVAPATGLDVSDTLTVAISPGVSTHFVLLPPSPGTVDAPISVTIQARDQFNNLATGEQRSVTLTATGSVTNLGLVTFTNGVGSRAVGNTVAETATLSLTDTGATSVNVASTTSITFGSGLPCDFMPNLFFLLDLDPISSHISFLLSHFLISSCLISSRCRR